MAAAPASDAIRVSSELLKTKDCFRNSCARRTRDGRSRCYVHSWTQCLMQSLCASNGLNLAPAWPRKVGIFGLGLSVTNYEDAVQSILSAARNRLSAVVACQAVHAVI